MNTLFIVYLILISIMFIWLFSTNYKAKLFYKLIDFKTLYRETDKYKQIREMELRYSKATNKYCVVVVDKYY